MTQTMTTKSTDLFTTAKALEGFGLRLEPIDLSHLDDLAKNLLCPNAWHCVHWEMKTRSDLEAAIHRQQKARLNQVGNGFCMVIRATGEAVGISRYMEINRQHRSLEIGGTWIGESWQRTFVNTEAKLLMLSEAFENLHCQRVEFRVDSLNFQSQRAVQRIGAKFEGELRQSCLLPSGRRRDYKVYSILDYEWPNIKATLKWYLEKYV